MTISANIQSRLAKALCDVDSAQQLTNAITSPQVAILSSGTDATHLGFFGVTATTRSVAIVQTYSTAARTLANSTYQAITDSTGGTPSATFGAIVAPAANATTSLTADMTAVKNALAQTALSLNRLNTDLLNVKQVLNSVINDAHAYGFQGVSGGAPTISSISPDNASLAGNVPCVITGTGFTGATSLTFGGVPAQGWAVASDTEIHAIMFPVAAAEVVDVEVTTPSGSATIPFTFAEVDVGSTVDRILFATNAEEIFGYIALAEDGNVWGTIQNTAKLLKLTPAGVATVVTVAGYTDGAAICSGPDGNLAIVANLAPTVFRVSTAGTLIGSVATGATGGGLNYFGRSILFGPDGNLWVIHVKNDNGTNYTEVIRIEEDDTVTTLSLGSGTIAYQGVFASDGFLYVVDDNSNVTRKIFKVAQDLTLDSTITVSTIPAGCWLYGICVLGTGDLLVTYSDFDEINGVAIAAASGLATATTHAVVLSAGEFLNFPFPGPDGNAYVPTYFQDDTANVVKVTPAGSSSLIELTGSEDTSNSSFTGCVDANGQVCVAMGGTTGVVQPSVYKVDEA